MQELKLNSSNSNISHRWPAESYATETMPDGYQGAQNFHGAPLTGNQVVECKALDVGKLLLKNTKV